MRAGAGDKIINGALAAGILRGLKIAWSTDGET
jgi:hypothetical protein